MRVSVHQADRAQVGQMPVELPHLSLQSSIPQDPIAACVAPGHGIEVVRDAQEAEPQKHGVQLAVEPVAPEILELREEIVEGVVPWVEALDVVRFLELGDI